MTHRLATAPTARKPAARIFLTFALFASLAGCGGGAPLFTSDGRPTTQVSCAAGGPWDTCFENARGICGGDVDTIQQSVDNGSRKLLFACKAKSTN